MTHLLDSLLEHVRKSRAADDDSIEGAVSALQGLVGLHRSGVRFRYEKACVSCAADAMFQVNAAWTPLCRHRGAVEDVSELAATVRQLSLQVCASAADVVDSCGGGSVRVAMLRCVTQCPRSCRV
jgi:hypothetical protein